MTSPIVTPARLQEMRRLYQDAQSHGQASPNVARTPDGSLVVSCATDYGSCLSSGSSWAQATTAAGADVYYHKTHSDTPYHGAAVVSNGSLAYFGQTVNHHERIVEAPIRPRGFLAPLRRFEGMRTVLKLDQPTRALAVSPDDRHLAFAVGGDIRQVDRDRGWLSTTLGAPQTIAHLPDAPYSLRYLSDGSVLAFSDQWQRVCFLVTPAGTQPVSRRDLDPDGFRQQVSRSVRDVVSPTQLDAFFQASDWLADGTGDVRPHRSCASPDGKQTAVTVAEKNGAALWSWDGQQARRVADLGKDVGAEYAGMQWTADGSHLLLLGGSGRASSLRIVDMADGRQERVDGVGASNAYQASNDGERMAVFSSQGPTLMLWEHATGRLRPLLALAPSDAPARESDVRLQFTPDGSHVVLCYAPRGMKTVTAHVVGLDGADTAIPCLDAARLEGNTLHVTLGGQDHTIAVPGGLAEISKQPWYQAPPDAALFGHAPTGAAGHIEVEKDDVRLGSVVVPVRR